ncbi:MAG TPA: FMN-binding protein [bacterium]|nr:FMN-binding protein [bacterium]
MMQENRRIEIRMAAVLTAVTLVSGFSLAFVWKSSAEKIHRNQEKEIESGIKKIFPGADKFEKKGSGKFIFYKLFKGAEFAGYSFITAGDGFQGEIKILCGMNPDLSQVSGVEILENVETPGLGNRITEEGFRGQLKGKTSPLFLNDSSRKDGVDAITGATISSKSVIAILNNGMDKLKKEVNQ